MGFVAEALGAVTRNQKGHDAWYWWHDDKAHYRALAVALQMPTWLGERARNYENNYSEAGCMPTWRSCQALHCVHEQIEQIEEVLGTVDDAMVYVEGALKVE